MLMINGSYTLKINQKYIWFKWWFLALIPKITFIFDKMLLVSKIAVHMFENLNDGEHIFTDDKVFIYF